MPSKATPSYSKTDLMRGFAALDRLWEKNLLPEELERHYFLYWFTKYGGNIIKTSEALQIHRNTVQNHFQQFGYSKKAVRLRHAWRMTTLNKKKTSLESIFFKFYQKYGGKTKWTAETNKRLIKLWQTTFPVKTLTAHYLLWAIRTHKTKPWIEEKLDYTHRHRIRLSIAILDAKTRNGYWLAPLKPKPEEIYSARYRSRVSKR